MYLRTNGSRTCWTILRMYMTLFYFPLRNSKGEWTLLTSPTITMMAGLVNVHHSWIHTGRFQAPNVSHTQRTVTCMKAEPAHIMGLYRAIFILTLDFLVIPRGVSGGGRGRCCCGLLSTAANKRSPTIRVDIPEVTFVQIYAVPCVLLLQLLKCVDLVVNLYFLASQILFYSVGLIVWSMFPTRCGTCIFFQCRKKEKENYWNITSLS